MSHRTGSNIGILGAGIMGCCLALELAHRGYDVDLLERSSTPVTGASLHNEGKLHLGFVYAKDPLKETHRLMARGSLTFSRILRQLTGHGADVLKPSRPFHYFVPRDSQLGIAAIEAHFHQVEETVHEFTKTSGDLYLDLKIDRFHRRTPSKIHDRLFSPDLTQGSFETEERAVSPTALARVLREAVARHPKVHFLGDTEVRAVIRFAGGDVGVEASRKNLPVQYRYVCAANCLWDDRVRVDRTAGIRENVPWIFRYKATVNIGALPAADAHIPSATGILGAYGDVVNHGDGSCYVSWYPKSKIAQCTHEDGRVLHDRVHRGFLPRSIRKMTEAHPSLSKFVAGIAHSNFIKSNIRGMAAYVPSMNRLLDNGIRGEVGGGVIVARGRTDIDDPGSILHQRSLIGPIAHGSYVTVDTGKLCMAPLFARETADLMVEVLS